MSGSIGWILGRGGGLQDDRARLRLAIFFAKARMGWTVANRQQSDDPPIDVEAAKQSLDKKIARLMRGLKTEETGGASAG